MKYSYLVKTTELFFFLFSLTVLYHSSCVFLLDRGQTKTWRRDRERESKKRERERGGDCFPVRGI